MSAFWYHVIRAWDFLLGLRITTRRERDRMAAHVKTYQRKAAQAEAEKRNAHRLVAMLSEPLKDWDLEDFPAWAETPGTVFLEGYWEKGYYPLTLEDLEHLTKTVQAYRNVAGEVARIRAGAKVNDLARRRGYDDVDLDSPAAQRALLRYRRSQRLENPRTLP